MLYYVIKNAYFQMYMKNNKHYPIKIQYTLCKLCSNINVNILLNYMTFESNLNHNRSSHQLNDEQIAELENKQKANLEKTYEFLEDIAREFEFEEVNSFDELDLSTDQISKLTHIKRSSPNSGHRQIVYFKKNLDNGETVKFCAQPSGLGNTIAAEVFSNKAGYLGHSSNHDFSYNEFRSLISKTI